MTHHAVNDQMLTTMKTIKKELACCREPPTSPPDPDDPPEASLEALGFIASKVALEVVEKA